jgi:hypothetical protein
MGKKAFSKREFVTERILAGKRPAPSNGFKRWLLKGQVEEPEGPHEQEGEHKPHVWWKVMCLTGVDYFSTLGYQPGIAFVAASFLSPIATLMLVLLTLFGALPMYKRIAERSPHGDGSISILERLMPEWWGKLLVLALIGFAATGFIITITLSAADATAHLVENPLINHVLDGQEVPVTLGLIAALGLVFLRGFKEAVGIAVVLVAIFIALNIAVVGYGLFQIGSSPVIFSNWLGALTRGYSNPLAMIVASVVVFPRLALGLSGFETGVVVMPLVKGSPDDDPNKPLERIRNTHKLLTVAAVIMSVMLLASSVVTTMLIPPEAFQEATADHPAGEANGRALAYLAHHMFGNAFGTVYDLSTIFILWFAGASAMAGLLNIVPRYLPRYGMAPEWSRAVRPLVLVFTGACFLITVIFHADVETQASPYATGVLGLMMSASVAVALVMRKEGKKGAFIGFSIVSVIFIYAMAVNVWKQPEGLGIAIMFTLAIMGISFLSRIWRMLELRVEEIVIDNVALELIDEISGGDKLIRIIPNFPEERNEVEYQREEQEARDDHQIPVDEDVLFFEVYITDPSEFSGKMVIKGYRYGKYRVLRAQATAIPNAIAAFLIWVWNRTGKRPHAYLNWTEGNPIVKMLTFLLFGKGENAPVTREILRRIERDPDKRPVIHSA